MAYNSKIKILHIMWAGVKGGAEKNMADIVTNLNNDNFSMEVLLLSKKDYWGDFIENKGVKVYSLHLKTARSLKSIFLFIKFLLKQKYALYHNHVSAPFVKIILKMFGKKVIHTLHNNPVALGNMNIIKRKLIIGFADFYIVPSRYMKNYFEKYHKIKAKLIYHGINIRSLTNKRKAQAEHSICKIGTLTHLYKMKGNDILINAAKVLVDKGINNFRMYIAGDGKEYENLKLLIDNLSIGKYVKIISFVKDTEDFLNNLDIYVSASLCESLGISVLEAMEKGLPIVSTNITAFLEIVDNNINGFICQPTPENIARSLEKLINNKELREQFGKASYKIVSKKFNLKNMLDEYRKVYLKCAE